MNDSPYRSPNADEFSEPPVPPKSTVRSVVIQIFVVGAILGVLALLLLPNVRIARGPARRGICSNNLRQITLALQLYSDEHGTLPPAYTVDEEGNRLHSWRTLILPYVGRPDIYQTIDLSKPWNDPVNAEAAKTRLKVYQCPSAALEDGQTTYLAIVSPGGCLNVEPRKQSDITDDAGQTLVLLEVPEDQAVSWMSPYDADEALVLGIGPNSKLPHRGGVNGAFADGHVHFLPNDLTADQWRALISISGDDGSVLERFD